MENINKNKKIVIDKAVDNNFANDLMFTISICLHEGGKIIIFKRNNIVEIYNEDMYLSLKKEELRNEYFFSKRGDIISEPLYISEYMKELNNNSITDELILNTTNKIIEDIKKRANIYIDMSPDIKYLDSFKIKPFEMFLDVIRGIILLLLLAGFNIALIYLARPIFKKFIYWILF